MERAAEPQVIEVVEGVKVIDVKSPGSPRHPRRPRSPWIAGIAHGAKNATDNPIIGLRARLGDPAPPYLRRQGSFTAAGVVGPSRKRTQLRAHRRRSRRPRSGG